MRANVPQLAAETVQPFEKTQAEKLLKRAKRLAIISLMCGLVSLLINPFTFEPLLIYFTYLCLSYFALVVVSIILGIIAIYLANPHKGSKTRRTTIIIATIGIISAFLSILPYIYFYYLIFSKYYYEAH